MNRRSFLLMLAALLPASWFPAGRTPIGSRVVEPVTRYWRIRVAPEDAEAHPLLPENLRKRRQTREQAIVEYLKSNREQYSTTIQADMQRMAEALRLDA